MKTAALICCTAALLCAAPADAKEPREFELGAGGLFYAGSSFMTEPADKALEPGSSLQVLYPGFAGFGPGGGVMIDFRYRGFVGLEIDFINVGDSAQTKINGEEIFIRQSSLHVPVLLKAVLPTGIINPSLAFGIDFVSPDAPEIEIAQPRLMATNYTAHAESYSAWTFGLGFEFVLPIDQVDVRIPLNFRGMINPSVPESARERATYITRERDGYVELLGVDFQSEWQYHAAITLGASYYFL